MMPNEDEFNEVKSNDRFGLTRQEKKILLAIVLGMSNFELQNHFVLSHETIKTHIKHIRNKMGEEFPVRKNFRPRGKSKCRG